MHSSAKSSRGFLHTGEAQTLAFIYLGRCTYEVAPVVVIADGRSLETGQRVAEGSSSHQKRLQQPKAMTLQFNLTPKQAEKNLLLTGTILEQDQDHVEGSSC